jgi:hypothetical protein
MIWVLLLSYTHIVCICSSGLFKDYLSSFKSVITAPL